jgi:hypothetical protein
METEGAMVEGEEIMVEIRGEVRVATWIGFQRQINRQLSALAMVRKMAKTKKKLKNHHWGGDFVRSKRRKD